MGFIIIVLVVLAVLAIAVYLFFLVGRQLGSKPVNSNNVANQRPPMNWVA